VHQWRHVCGGFFEIGPLIGKAGEAREDSDH